MKKPPESFTSLLDILPVAAYICDMDGRITGYNDLAAGLWGRHPTYDDRFNGAYKLYTTDDTYLPHDQTPSAGCLRDGLPRKDVEIIVQRPDQSRIYVRINVAPLKDEEGRQVGMINCFYDITAQKAAEKQRQIESLRPEGEGKYRTLASMLERNVMEKMQELKKSEDRYHKMVEQVEDYAIILLDREGIIQNWNIGAEKIKGYKENEIVGKSFQEFYLPEDRQKGLPLSLLNEAREKGKAIHEGWRKRSNGTAFWGSIVLTALHDDQHEIIGFSKVTRDLTERKFAEDKMKKYLAQLEFQNRELEQFVYAASHDLKEPLRKIHLYNNFVAENPANALDPKSREYLQRSINASTRMKILIEDLLTYSRATANVEGYDMVDLNTIVDEIIAIHKEEFGQKRVTIKRGDLAVIQAVPFQINQLLLNLIDNAVKYRHPDRTPNITISHKLVEGDTLTEYELNPDVQYHMISVKDNGIGFDARYASRIFEIFQRLDSNIGINGSGIGLSICKKIVQNHNGAIMANGNPGKGASFIIYLPKNQ